MSKFEIKCTSCGAPFELSEALAGPMLDAERRKAEAEAERRFALERKAIEQAAAEKVRAEGAETIAELRRAAEAKDGELAHARDAELAARKAIQEAEEAKRNVELEVARRVAARADAAALQAREETAKEFSAKLEAAESALAETEHKQRSAEEAELVARKSIREAEQAKRNVELEVARRVASEGAVASERVREETTRQFTAELQAARLAVSETETKRRAAEDAELAALKAKREAEDAMRTTELNVARRLEEERDKVREHAFHECDVEYRLKVAEKDKQLADLKEKMDELRRKADQGSQQLAGDVLEIDMIDMLTAAYPMDRFERTGKGQRGADVRQVVIGPGALMAGIVLWEAKRTKTWSDGWLPKVREDQRAAKADVAVIATETLPADVMSFDCVDGVWVTGFPTVVPLAGALRQGVIEAARARRAAASGDQTKDLVYAYVTGTEFRRRAAGLLEPIIEIRTALECERRTMTRQWSQRAKQIERMALGIAGLYGDLQGLIGPSLPEVEGLTLLEASADERVDVPKLESGDGAAASGEVH